MNKPQIELDIKTKKFLRDFYSIISLLDVPMLLIGAQARLLILDNPYQIQGRATKDWDIAVKLDGWERYNLLVDQMTTGETPLFKTTRVIHKFIHIHTEIEVDIIPFGNISNRNQEITWPDGNKMSTLGLEEALLNTKVEIIDNLQIQVADIDAFIALKLLAWSERKANKDLIDIIAVLKKPANAQEEEQIYHEFNDQIITGEFEVDEAGVIFFGRNIRNKFQQETLQEIRKVIAEILQSQNQYLSEVTPKNSDCDLWDQEFEKIVRRFQLLQKGLENPSGI